MKVLKSTNNFDILVDDEDYEFLSRFKWNVVTTKDGNTYARTKPDRKTNITIHQLLMKSGGNVYVDHIDHNGLNNQKINLRLCNNKQNQANSKKNKRLLSQYKGVSYSKSKKKWRAYISPDRKFIHLGYFDLEIDAMNAYNEAAIKHFGEFAFLNKW